VRPSSRNYNRDSPVKKILIVDDDELVARTYQLKLKSCGFDAAIAADGTQGMVKLAEYDPDLVILDLILPGITGFEVLNLIRKNARFNKLPVLLLSNHYLETGSNSEIDAGLNRSMVKAETTPTKVVEVITEMLALSERTRTNPLQRARDRFCDSVIDAIAPMRLALQTIARAQTGDSQAFRVIKGHAETITAAAAELALSRISHLTSALAGLSQQLSERPGNSTASTSRTIAGALDALDQLAKAGLAAENLAAPLGLIVEDERVSQQIVRTALDRSQIRSIMTASGEFALQILELNRFDVIFLDVTLPGINGYQVCTALRKLALHAATPVIFITALKEFDARAQSILSGANDLIAKPASVSELAVKALTHVIKGK